MNPLCRPTPEGSHIVAPYGLWHPCGVRPSMRSGAPGSSARGSWVFDPSGVEGSYAPHRIATIAGLYGVRGPARALHSRSRVARGWFVPREDGPPGARPIPRLPSPSRATALRVRPFPITWRSETPGSPASENDPLAAVHPRLPRDALPPTRTTRDEKSRPPPRTRPATAPWAAA